MTSRRDFIRGAGILGLFVGGAAVGKTVVVQQGEIKPEPEDISHLAPLEDSTLVLQGNKKPQDPPPAGTTGFYFANNEYQNKVHMSVGKDDRLWIKVGDQWKRVVVE